MTYSSGRQLWSYRFQSSFYSSKFTFILERSDGIKKLEILDVNKVAVLLHDQKVDQYLVASLSTATGLALRSTTHKSVPGCLSVDLRIWDEF